MIADLLRLELLLQLRGRALPLLLAMPLIAGVGAAWKPRGAAGLDSMAERPVAALAVAAPDAVADMLDADALLEVVARSPEGFEAVPEGARLAVAVDGDGYALRGDGAITTRGGRRAFELLEQQAREGWVAEWAAAGVDADALLTTSLNRRDPLLVRAGSLSLFPLLWMATIALAAYSSANQAFAGSRQHKTRHTQGLLPIDLAGLVRVKTLAVGLFASGVGLGMLVAWLVASRLLNGSLPIGVGVALPLLLVGLATTAQLASLWSLVSAWAADLRSMSYVAGFVLLVVFAAGLTALLPEPPLVVALVPLAGSAAAIRAALEGEHVGVLGLALVASVGWTMLGTWATARVWERERGEVRRTGAKEAASVFVVSILLFWFLGSTATALDSTWGMLFAQIGLIALPGVVALAWLGRPVRETLSLRPARPHQMLGAWLLGTGLPWVGMGVYVAQQAVITIPEGYAELFTQQLVSDRPFLLNALMLCALPAICEELLFRGALLGLCRDAMSDRRAVVVVAMGFGLLHLDVTRLLPTMVLGLVFGAIVLRTRSLLPAMACHGLNNLTLIAFDTFGDGLPPWAPYTTVFTGLLGAALLFRKNP